MSFPELKTERLTLRGVGKHDLQALFDLRSHPETMHYIGKPLAHSLEDVVPLLGNMCFDGTLEQGITWAICTHQNPAMIGFIGFWRIQQEHYRAEIGYMLGEAFCKQGIMHEALQSVVSFGFEKLGFHSIEASIDPENQASLRLLEKNNFMREAHFKENYYFEGKFYDTYVYSKLSP